MADRKQTPDIMSELLTGLPEAKSERQHDSMTAKSQASKPTKQKAGKPTEKKARAEKRPAPPLDEEKTKATFYLSQEGIESLESSWMKLRSLAGSERGRVSKSALVEQALLRLQKDLKQEAAAILKAIL